MMGQMLEGSCPSPGCLISLAICHEGEEKLHIEECYKMEKGVRFLASIGDEHRPDIMSFKPRQLYHKGAINAPHAHN